MSASLTAARASADRAHPYRQFRVSVAAVRPVGASFVRVTFTGPDLDLFADNGLDQRVKLVLPLANSDLHPLPDGPDWYARWRLLPEGLRNPVRTYTVRQARPALGEVDLEMVLHGDGGPASRFAAHARPGDRAVLVGPDARFRGDHAGREFQMPAGHRGPLLVAADETALPAVTNIAAALPPQCQGRLLLEVPHAADVRPLDLPPGVAARWLPREGRRHGELLVAATMALLAPSPGSTPPGSAPAGDDDATEEDGLLWDVAGSVPPTTDGLYAWLAGEASAIRAIRRHLVGRLGHDRRSVSFMGYWRDGTAEA
jgi:NADPH-dependent ferric siderophore reductase